MNVHTFLSHRRKPRFKLPPGTCDAHCHVFGPAAKFPYAPNRRYTPEDAPKEMLAALHAHLGIERAVIVQASCHGTDNAAMLDCIASDPKHYRGVAIVNDSFTDADFDRLDASGVRGVVRHTRRWVGRRRSETRSQIVVDLSRGTQQRGEKV